MQASRDYIEDEPRVIDETVAVILNENLTRFSLPQLSSQEQFRLVDTIECVAMVEKHRRSMDANAARYLLFFRQHMLRRSQGVAHRNTVSWREIVWAFHSESQDILKDLVSRQFGGKFLWKAARESGIFMWLSDITAVVGLLRTALLSILFTLTISRDLSLKSSLAMSIQKRMRRIRLTVRYTIWLYERRTFSKVCGVWQPGIVNRVPQHAYWRIISRKQDGGRLH